MADDAELRPRPSLATDEHRRAARRRRRRRNQVRAVVAVLLLIALGAGYAAYATGSDDAASAADTTPSTASTPVLSTRRVGPLIAGRLADAQIQPALQQFAADAPANSCLTVQVGDREVFAHNPDAPVAPASTQKLVTGTVLLEQLGADTKLRTTLATDTPAGPDGVIAGDLYFVGAGDPLLQTKAYADHFFDQPQKYTSLEALADALKAAGVTRIDGRLLGDESKLDTLRVVPSWSPRFTQQHQLGPLSALTVNDNVTAWGAKQVPLEPDGEAVADPPTNAADQLAQLLQERGVPVGGTGAGTAPVGAKEVAGIDSLPIKEMVAEMLQESDNQTAETLVKVLGAAKGGGPTTADGVAVVKTVAAGLGIPAAGLAPVDGSGLDDTNRQTCRTLNAALADTPESSQLVQLLATAGQTGTLTTRFRDTPLAGRLRAKTGSLNGVSAFAGMLPTAGGSTVTFAFVQNGTDTRLSLQQDLATLLDAYPAAGLPTAEVLGPQPVR